MGPSRDSPVEAVIRQMRPRTLFTVPGGARFEVDNLAPDAVELLFGGSKDPHGHTMDLPGGHPSIPAREGLGRDRCDP